MDRDFALPLMIGAGALVATLLAVFVSPEEGASAVAGVGLGLLNYQWLYRGSVRFFQAAEMGGAGSGLWVVMAMLRLGFFVGGMLLLLKWGSPPMGIVIGLSVPVFSQVVWSSYKVFSSSAQVRS
ncbi:MAG: hypothetical protein CL917_13485 [Deltaproteobacteria bacterium]|nr:hypothetical protein [Deltaproteobacteria bacterium]